jgi:chromosome segregation ATPase
LENCLSLREKNLTKLEEERTKLIKSKKRYDDEISKYKQMNDILLQEKEVFDENRQVFAVREDSLTEAEKELKKREIYFNDMQKIIESEMNQLIQDRDKMEIENKDNLDKLEKIKNERIRLEADITNFQQERENFMCHIDNIKSKLLKMHNIDKEFKEDIEEILKLMKFSKTVDIDNEVVLPNVKTESKSFPYFFNIIKH